MKHQTYPSLNNLTFYMWKDNIPNLIQLDYVYKQARIMDHIVTQHFQSVFIN